MSDRVDAAFTAFHALTDAQKRQFLKGLLGQPAIPWDDDFHFVTLEHAAESLDKHKSQISRDIKSGKLLSNGEKGKKLRVARLSVFLVLNNEIKEDLIWLEKHKPQEVEVNRLKWLEKCRQYVNIFDEGRSLLEKSLAPVREMAMKKLLLKS